MPSGMWSAPGPQPGLQSLPLPLPPSLALFSPLSPSPLSLSSLSHSQTTSWTRRSERQRCLRACAHVHAARPEAPRGPTADGLGAGPGLDRGGTGALDGLWTGPAWNSCSQAPSCHSPRTGVQPGPDRPPPSPKRKGRWSGPVRLIRGQQQPTLQRPGFLACSTGPGLRPDPSWRRSVHTGCRRAPVSRLISSPDRVWKTGRGRLLVVTVKRRPSFGSQATPPR